MSVDEVPVIALNDADHDQVTRRGVVIVPRRDAESGFVVQWAGGTCAPWQIDLAGETTIRTTITQGAINGTCNLILDPFLGVGSTAIGALMHDRRFLGFELDEAYLLEARARIAAFRSGALKIRPLGQPVATPSGKVAAVPSQWLDDARARDEDLRRGHS